MLRKSGIAIILVFGLIIACPNIPSKAAERVASGTSALRWVDEFGTDGLEEHESISASRSGIYVAGSTSGTLPGQTDFGGPRDAFVRKYSSSGSLKWTHQFGTSGGDLAYGIAASRRGIFVVGLTTGRFAGEHRHGGFDGFVRKYTASGEVVWTRQFGTRGDEEADTVGISSKGIFVLGVTTRRFPGQVFHGGFSDAFLRKYAQGGRSTWTRQFGTRGDEVALQIAVTRRAIYVGGATDSRFVHQKKFGGFDAFLQKYTPHGRLRWTDQFGTAQSEQLNGVTTLDGKIYVGGVTEGTFAHHTRQGKTDGFLRKYRSSGQKRWTRQFGTSTYDGVSGVAKSGSRVVVCGFTDGSLQDARGRGDVFVRSYEQSGKRGRTRQFGTTEGDDPGPITSRRNKQYMVGGTDGTFPGFTNHGNGDVFVAALR